jgi:DNA repair exonuclease SbcCD ATPase subunit
MGGTAWSNVESNLREAKKTLAELTRQRHKQDEDLRKLKQLARRVERITDDVAGLKRTMDDMEQRMRRLESRS